MNQQSETHVISYWIDHEGSSDFTLELQPINYKHHVLPMRVIVPQQIQAFVTGDKLPPDTRISIEYIQTKDKDNSTARNDIFTSQGKESSQVILLTTNDGKSFQSGVAIQLDVSTKSDQVKFQIRATIPSKQIKNQILSELTNQLGFCSIEIIGLFMEQRKLLRIQ